MPRSYTVYAIDFDGTIVSNAWPEIGDINPEASQFIRDLQRRGDKWILYTMREGELLKAALERLEYFGLKPDAVNDNLEELKAEFSNNPRKVYADVYIDDHNAGGLRFEDTAKIPRTQAEHAMANIKVAQRILNKVNEILAEE